MWVSLIGSAFGLLSVFNDLIPNLIRLSLIVRAGVAAYRLGREWVYDRIQIAFSWINFELPEIPDAVKDALVIVALVLAALNFDSVRRFGEGLVFGFLRRLIQFIRQRFTAGDSLFDSTEDALIAGVAGTLIGGVLLHFVAEQMSFHGDWPWWAHAAEIVAYGTLVLFVLTFASLLKERSPHLVFQAIGHSVIILVGLPLFVIIAMGVALLNGWRAVVLACGIVVALVGLNYLCLNVLEPTIKAPPAWLTQLITADPQSLPEN